MNNKSLLFDNIISNLGKKVKLNFQVYTFTKSLLEITHKFYLLQNSKTCWNDLQVALSFVYTILSLNFPSIMPSYYRYLSYCNIVWSFTHNSHLNRIYLLQKRAIRALTNSKYRAHFAPLFARLTILNSLVTVFLRSMSLNLCSAITIISYFLLF